MTARELRDELLGLECRCDKTKGRGETFCYHCFLTLPRKMQRDLYKLIGEGYEEAYGRALAHLEQQESPPKVLGKFL